MKHKETTRAAEAVNISNLSKTRFVRDATFALFTIVTVGSAFFTNGVSAANESDLQPVNISFAGEFAGQAFDCSSQYLGTGATGAQVTVSEFKVYVSRVRMIDDAGREHAVVLDDDGLWQQQNVALLDFENGEGNCTNGTPQTNSSISGMVAAGQYSGVAFDVGVPFEMNHVDPTLAASPMNLTSMFWNWRGGYRFIRVDLAVVGGMKKNMDAKHSNTASKTTGRNMVQQGSAHAGLKAVSTKQQGMPKKHGAGRGWSLHVGSTGCQATGPTMAPTSCKAPNRISVRFDEFDSSTDILVIDPANVLTQVDVTSNTPETAPGCMSSPKDPECPMVFDLLGIGGSSTEQKLISVR